MMARSSVPDAGTHPALLLVEEISHRVINEYTEAISSLSLAAHFGSQQPQEALSMAANRLRAHAEAHRALLPPADDKVANLADYIGRLCGSLSKASLAENGVRITLEADEVLLPADGCWRVGLIVAELVRNAARHGLRGRAGEIVVRLAERSGWISCEVCDNGRAAEDAEPGRGLRLIQSIAAELGGTTAWWFTPAGSLVRVNIPGGDPSLA